MLNSDFPRILCTVDHDAHFKKCTLKGEFTVKCNCLHHSTNILILSLSADYSDAWHNFNSSRPSNWVCFCFLWPRCHCHWCGSFINDYYMDSLRTVDCWWIRDCVYAFISFGSCFFPQKVQFKSWYFFFIVEWCYQGLTLASDKTTVLTSALPENFTLSQEVTFCAFQPFGCGIGNSQLQTMFEVHHALKGRGYACKP